MDNRPRDPEPKRTNSEKLECIQNDTHVIREIVLTNEAGRWLLGIWSKKGAITHRRHGPGGANGGGVYYEYTISYKIWQSRYKNEYHVRTGGSRDGYRPGDSSSSYPKEIYEKPSEPLINLYRFIEEHYPNQILRFSIVKKPEKRPPIWDI